MKEIKRVPLSRLTAGAHFTFMSNILARAEADAAVTGKAGELVKALRAAVEEEDGSMGLSRKSLLTDDIAKADRRRDAFYSGYKKMVEGLAKMEGTDAAKTAAALLQHIRDYRIKRAFQLDRETGLLTNFIADLQGRYAAQVEALSLTAFVTGMKEANDSLRELTLRRTEERTGVRVGAFKAARTAADAAYRELVRMVNALAVVFGEADYADFIDYCNTEIASFRRQTPGKKADATGRKKTRSADSASSPTEDEAKTAGAEVKTAAAAANTAETEAKTTEAEANTAEAKVKTTTAAANTAAAAAKSARAKASPTGANANLTDTASDTTETGAITTGAKASPPGDNGNSEDEEDTTTKKGDTLWIKL